jgi:hypothetical protein
MNYPVKSGLAYSTLYVVFISICVGLAYVGIGGTSEGNLFMWLVLFTALPTIVLMKIFGVKVVLSGSTGSNAYFFVLLQIALLYGIGYLVGRWKTKRKV